MDIINFQGANLVGLLVRMMQDAQVILSCHALHYLSSYFAVSSSKYTPFLKSFWKFNYVP